MPTPSPRLGLALPSQPDDFSTADLRINWEKIDAAPGTFICTSTSRPAWGANQIGREIFETNTGVKRAWTGSGWLALTPEPGDLKTSSRIDTPEGWLPCDGRVLSRATYSQLFAAIGTAHNTGGETTSEFRIPNLIGRVIVGRNPTTGAAFNVIGQRDGNESMTLLATHLPPHAHSMQHDHDISHFHTGSTDGAGAHSHSYATSSDKTTNARNLVPAGGANTNEQYLLGGGDYQTSVGGVHAHTFTTNWYFGRTDLGSSAVTGNGPGASTAFSLRQPSLTMSIFIKV